MMDLVIELGFWESLIALSPLLAAVLLLYPYLRGAYASMFSASVPVFPYPNQFFPLSKVTLEKLEVKEGK